MFTMCFIERNVDEPRTFFYDDYSISDFNPLTFSELLSFAGFSLSSSRRSILLSSSGEDSVPTINFAVRFFDNDFPGHGTLSYTVDAHDLLDDDDFLNCVRAILNTFYSDGFYEDFLLDSSEEVI